MNHNIATRQIIKWPRFVFIIMFILHSTSEYFFFVWYINAD